MKDETKIWMQHAKDDFDGMEFLLDKRMYGLAILHAQQAVEKIIKAYIIENKEIYPRKIHDIDLLLEQAGLNYTDATNEEIKELTLGFTRSRYPDMSKEYYATKEKIEPIISLTRKLYLWIKAQLPDN